MDLKYMILVTENDRGTETNMLMTLDDYKSFIAIDDMSELAENLLQLGRTLGEADNFAEYYRAANVTIQSPLVRQSISVIRRMRSLQRTIPQSEYRGSMAFILVPHSQPRISRHTRGSMAHRKR